MAQRIGPPGTARIAISGGHFGLPWANVFWLNLAGGSTATQAAFDTIVSGVFGAYNNAFQTSLSNQTTITLANGVLFQSPTTVLHSTFSAANAGLLSTPFVQDNAAAVVLSCTSNAYWRGGKPRTYLPGIPTSQMADNHQLSATADTDYTNHGNSFHTALNALSATGITQSQHGFVKFFSGGVLL